MVVDEKLFVCGLEFSYYPAYSAHAAPGISSQFLVALVGPVLGYSKVWRVRTGALLPRFLCAPRYTEFT